MKIQMVDVRRQYRKLKPEMDAAVLQVMESGQFIGGPDVDAFSREIEDYLGVLHAIPCASGTDALQLALMAIDLKPGEEVITSPFTFVATAETIALLGGKPVYVDIDEQTYNLNPDLIEAAITSRTRAIIPVHLFGQAADMDPILEIAQKHNLTVIEDAAQALGATYKGKKICTFGHMSCISFFPSKNLGSYGDAGMVVTNDAVLAEKVRMIANHGSKVRYHHDLIGVNSRLDSIQAAILRVKLPHLDKWNLLRREKAEYYSTHLPENLIKPFEASWAYHIYHQYTLRTPQRDELRDYLGHKDIPSAIYYPIPLHIQPAYRNLYGYQEGDFPVSERVAREVISLPMHPDLNEEELNYIADTIGEFFKNVK